MAQNITLMGASYSDVPAVELPKTGGGTALFSDPSITTAIASDVASGKTFLLADGSIGTGTASGGGGGASNIVTGTFKGATTGAAMDVDLAYTGNGYPIAVWIYPSEGSYNSSGTFYSLIQRYVVDTWAGVKCMPSVVPYTGSTTGRNDMTTHFRYKSSATSATSYSSGGTSNATVLQDAAATSSTNNLVRIRNSKKMSVFIASTSYGFAANIEYTYQIIYSS